jgi:hypothetical protein
MQSLTEKPRRNGKPYRDKLFTSIHRSIELQEVRFYFYRANELEARQVISALPLVVQEELGLDAGCFFHKTDIAGVLTGVWDSTKRIFKNHQTINQEQYLEDLDDCFMANKEFLPEVVILDMNTIGSDAAKAMAIANGTDDVSILSQLTEKTLKEATSRRPNDTQSIHSLQSQESGNTSKSKTQAAVKEALKDVSLQHNQAMKEQQEKYQKEIETLCRALESRSMSELQNTATDTNSIGQGQNKEMIIDSSDDETNKTQSQLAITTSPTRSVKSPAHKRPKRGHGVRQPSTAKLNE